MAIRGFVAVHVPAEPALAALLRELAGLGREVKPVAPENLHFTLSFLGDIPEEAPPRIADALREAVAGSRGFDVRLHGVGAFPSARRPRVVWAGVDDPRALVELAVKVRQGLARAGFTGDDKDFRAHLTLARVREGARTDPIVQFLREHGRDDLPSATIHEVALYQSTLGPAGPTYTPLAAVPLEA